MTVLDFKEIPQANLATGLQDEFEFFARDFFEYIGYETISEPSRGADGGIDICIKESRKGVGGKTDLLWLVSCKHYAHSERKKSVGIDDEINIDDRVISKGCHGFIGFYSTIISNGLKEKIESWSIKTKKEFQIFDRAKIETYLLKDKNGIYLAQRYFQNSIKSWLENNPLIVNSKGKEKLRKECYEDYLERKGDLWKRLKA